MFPNGDITSSIFIAFSPSEDGYREPRLSELGLGPGASILTVWHCVVGLRF